MQVGEREEPKPGPGEVLVRLAASGINPSDTKKRMGWRGKKLEFPLIIPHHDGAGEIADAGPGVDRSRKGQRVWLYNAQYGRPFGTAAEYVCVPADRAVPLPEGVSFSEGACLGVPASTAHFAVFADGPVKDQVILVAGGAGAVGHYAIQFAKWGGAKVIATVSSDVKAEHARRGGADHTVNYKREKVAERVLEWTSGQGVDRIVEVDLGANLQTDAAIIKPNGVIASYSSTRVPEPVFPYYPLAYKGVTLSLVQAYILPGEARIKATQDINACLEQGRLRNCVAREFPLDETALAHEAVEAGGLIGTAVISIRG